MAKPKERPDYEDRAIQSMASPKEAPFSTHLMQWGGGPAPDQSYLPGTEPKYSAMPTIYPSGDGLIQMEPGLAAAYARDTGEYREFDTPEEAAAYAENGLIDHSPGSLANVEAMRKEGSDHPYSVDNIMSMGYNRNKAEAIYRILNRTVVGGLYPMIGPGAAGRTEAQAAANKKNNKGSTTTKHYVTEPGDPISRFLDDEDTARAIDIKFYKMPVSEWRKQYGPKKDPLGKHLYREDDAAKRIYAEALASEGWGQPTYDEEMLSRGFKPGDWGHAEPIETMRAPKGLYTSRPGFTLSNPVLDTASSKMADAAVTAAMSEKSAKLAQESTKPSEPNDGSDIMPRPQLAGVLQSLADMGYEDDVVEYLTTSQDPSQPIKQRNIAEEMGSAYKTDPMNDGSVKYGVYIPGSGLGGAVRSGPRMAYEGMRISSKPYAEQAYKNEALVRVSETPGAGEPAWNAQLLHDAVKGLNKKHAEATARANWPGRKVEVIDFGPKGRFDKLLEEVAPLEEMLEKIWRNKK